ncbi:ribonuclease M5 [Mesoplasma florum]|uniref:ribonuclease M5 n=1 Tax=Mesoplasma florum TaxID=2151 RepID=UPI000BE3F421|nr:ribonuclease M5 [Mesoplasma florum]ATI72958.1 ribonuclease M5 [Mesoplasma florum]ATI73651.1 ribonuclease M5 [Mesoplasma florum]AVN61361.1 ribonuclease M5 [Mesoplasma florum]
MANEIIIVEGKSDSQKLKKIYGENLITFETNGLGIDDKKLNSIKELSKKNKIIIFTDPDGPGKKIRETIIEFLDVDVFNAFVSKQDIGKNSKKIGLAEASEEAIKKALDNLITYNKKNISISWDEYVKNDFYIKANRIIIANHFNLSEDMSSKSLFKWLNWMNLKVKDIEKIIGE